MKGKYEYMKYVYIILILVSTSGFANTALDGEYVQNEVLVTYANSITHSNVVKLKIKTSVEDAIEEFSKSPEVLSVQPNYIYHATNTTPNDEQYGQLWSLKNTGQTVTNSTYSTNNPGTAGYDLGMEKVWDVITDCSSVVVAVLDTGVNYNHNDLKNNMWDGSTNHGYDFVDDDNDPMDLNGHGTHVAGIIAAEGNNSIDSVGVCWNAKVMAVRILDIYGSGTTANIIAGINYAVTNGAKVINMSLSEANYDAAFKSAIDSAQTSGVLVVVSAGNDGADVEITPGYPCSYDSDNILCIAAVDQKFDIASFSNFGLTSVDIAAPGTNILSTLNGYTASVPLNTGWTNSGGWGYNATYQLLANPSTWNGSNKYSVNATAMSYRDLGDMTGVDIVTINFYAAVDLEQGYDWFKINYKASSDNPFSAGTQLAAFSSKESHSSIGDTYPFAYQLTSCANQPNCSVGYKLTSDATNQYTGVAITGLSYTKIGSAYSDELNVSDGTSFASPYVAGLATLLFAYNPNFTYADVKSSIMNGGESVPALSGNTVSGKVINGWGSLTYIDQPTGVTLEINQ